MTRIDDPYDLMLFGKVFFRDIDLEKMSNCGILGSTAIARMPVTQNLQVPYGSQNHILKGNLSRIPNLPSKNLKNNF